MWCSAECQVDSVLPRTGGAVYAGTDDTAGGAGGQLRRTEELPDAPLSANRAIPRTMPANTS